MFRSVKEGAQLSSSMTFMDSHQAQVTGTIAAPSVENRSLTHWMLAETFVKNMDQWNKNECRVLEDSGKSFSKSPIWSRRYKR